MGTNIVEITINWFFHPLFKNTPHIGHISSLHTANLGGGLNYLFTMNAGDFFI